MGKLILISLLLILNFSGYAQNQTERGVGAAKNTNTPTQGKTYAILIGISDYQDVRDLKYADRDAEVFYGYLNEVAKVPKKNIFLFTNKNANLKNIARALTLLDTTVKIGDKVIFFFAGHGDIEAENRPDETALLLLHDSPNGNYLAAQDGYIKLIDLKNAFDKFTEKNVSVQFYADACRSGAFNLINNNYQTDTLKGGVRGKNRFLNGIQQPWLNQIKYVSCQVNENSLEGTEYSCGRGLFSLHLIDGLMGMADTEKDGKITFAELRQYVDKMVRTQAKPRSQNPQKVNGDDNEDLALVDSTAFANYQLKQREFTKTHLGDCSPFLSGTNIKGDSTLLTDIDPQFREDYATFYKNLKAEKLLFPESNNAKKSFLSFEEKLKNPALHKSTTQFLKIVAGNMKADLIEGLQKRCMNLIKPLLFKIPDEIANYQYAVYDTAHLYMKEALNNMGKEHFLYKCFLARDLYLQAVWELKRPRNSTILDDKAFSRIDSLLNLSIDSDPDMPYVVFFLGLSNALIGNMDKAIENLKKGYKLMPNSPQFLNAMVLLIESYGSLGDIQESWILNLKKNQNNHVSNAILSKYFKLSNNFKEAEFYLNQSVENLKKESKDLNSLSYYFAMAELYNGYGDKEKAKFFSQKCFESDSIDFRSLFCQTVSLFDINNLEIVRPYVKKMVKYYPNFGLGRAMNAMLLITFNPYYALNEAKISLRYSPNNVFGLFAISLSYVATDSLSKALVYAQTLIKLYPRLHFAQNILGVCFRGLKRPKDALKSFLIANSLKPNDSEILLNIARTYNELEEYKNALHYYKANTKINTKQVLINWEIAEIYQSHLNKLDSAIYFYKKEIENNSGLFFSYIGIGLALESKENKNNKNNSKLSKEATEYFLTGISKAKEYKDKKMIPESVFHELKCFLEIKMEKLDEAEISANELIRIAPLKASGFEALASILIKREKYSKAYEALQMAIKKEPTSSSPYYNLACFYSLQNRLNECLENLEKSFINGYNNLKHINEDPDLNNVRENPKFKELISKYLSHKK